jgi:hypothetical protein
MKNSGFISILLLFMLLLAVFCVGAYITLNVRDTSIRTAFSDKTYGFTFTRDKTWTMDDNLESEGTISLTSTSSAIQVSIKNTANLTLCIGTEKIVGKDSFVCRRDGYSAYYLPLKGAYAGKMVFVESASNPGNEREVELIGRSLTFLQ